MNIYSSLLALILSGPRILSGAALKANMNADSSLDMLSSPTGSEVREWMHAGTGADKYLPEQKLSPTSYGADAPRCGDNWCMFTQVCQCKLGESALRKQRFACEISRPTDGYGASNSTQSTEFAQIRSRLSAKNVKAFCEQRYTAIVENSNADFAFPDSDTDRPLFDYYTGNKCFNDWVWKRAETPQTCRAIVTQKQYLKARAIILRGADFQDLSELEQRLLLKLFISRNLYQLYHAVEAVALADGSELVIDIDTFAEVFYQYIYVKSYNAKGEYTGYEPFYNLFINLDMLAIALASCESGQRDSIITLSGQADSVSLKALYGDVAPDMLSALNVLYNTIQIADGRKISDRIIRQATNVKKEGTDLTLLFDIPKVMAVTTLGMLSMAIALYNLTRKRRTSRINAALKETALPLLAPGAVSISIESLDAISMEDLNAVLEQ
ncbi:hypothetical protein PAPHI01_0657 [Pancytospora philotis]|nr:hypothetical protein PAPHI01_0657 [Pancytospora philotis]